MYRTYVLATEPIGSVQRDDVGLSDVMVWDTERPYHYARWTPEHRLLLGGEDRLVQPGQRRRQQFKTASRDLRAYFEARLPALATVRTERAWEGLFAMTADSLPYIGPHRRYPRHWFALGYGGNGMTFGFLAARLLLERWQGVKSRDHALFEFARLRKQAMTGDFDYSIVESTAHRPWPMPRAPWLMTQSWHDLLFAHWRVDVSEVRRAVPAAFDLDLFDGEAWLGVVPFHMTNVGLRATPALPWISTFPELNVRTYVRVADRPGVYFFSLDAARWLAVAAARTFLNLPYYTADMTVERRRDGLRYESARRTRERREFKAIYEPSGAPFVASAGSIRYFLTERYCLYHHNRRGHPYRLEIHHRPWSLQVARAAITTNTMAAASWRDAQRRARAVALRTASRRGCLAAGAPSRTRVSGACETSPSSAIWPPAECDVRMPVRLEFVVRRRRGALRGPCSRRPSAHGVDPQWPLCVQWRNQVACGRPMMHGSVPRCIDLELGELPSQNVLTA